MKVRDLLSDESKWTKGTSALDAAGCRVRADNPLAVSWCLAGALNKCYYWGVLDTSEWSRHIASLDDKVHESFIHWNDAPERTFADVRQLVEELDI